METTTPTSDLSDTTVFEESSQLMAENSTERADQNSLEHMVLTDTFESSDASDAQSCQPSLSANNNSGIGSKIINVSIGGIHYVITLLDETEIVSEDNQHCQNANESDRSGSSSLMTTDVCQDNIRQTVDKTTVESAPSHKTYQKQQVGHSKGVHLNKVGHSANSAGSSGENKSHPRPKGNSTQRYTRVSTARPYHYTNSLQYGGQKNISFNDPFTRPYPVSNPFQYGGQNNIPFNNQFTRPYHFTNPFQYGGQNNTPFNNQFTRPYPVTNPSEYSGQNNISLNNQFTQQRRYKHTYFDDDGNEVPSTNSSHGSVGRGRRGRKNQ